MRKLDNKSLVLKNTINENLISLKKRRITEKKEITKRLNLIYESKDFNKTRDLNKFYIEFLIENQRLLDRGYNQELISEQLVNLLFGYLGELTGKSVLSYFKEFAARYVLKKLGVETDTWVGSIIITAFGNLKFGDIPRLFSCSFWAPFLTKTIIESFVTRWQEKKGNTGAVSSVIRNAIEKMITDSEFAKLLEKQLIGVICPLLPDLSGKMKKVVGSLAPSQTSSDVDDESRKSTPSEVPGVAPST